MNHDKHQGFNLHSAVDLGKITVRDLLRRLEADTKLEASRAPVDELDATLGLQHGNSCMCVLRNNITTEQQARGHVLSVARVTFNHLVVWLEARHGDLLNRVGLVSSTSSRDNRGVGDQREVDAGVRHQVGLELVQVDVKGAVEPERGGD